MLRRDLRQRDGKVLGLMVQQHYAKRFILDSKEDRKSMEIRSKPVKFLNEGDKVALVSTNHGADRQVLAILEYQGCSKIKKADFHKYFQLHRVTLQEIEQFKFWENMTSDSTGGCWGWHMEAVHIFDPPLVYPVKPSGEMTWLYLKVDELCLPRIQRNGSSSSSLHEPVADICSEESTLKHKRSWSSSFANDSLDSSAKKAKAGTNESNEEIEDSALPWNFDDPDEQVHCIVLQEREFDGILKGHQGLLRPFKSRELNLCALVRREQGYDFVGILNLYSCTPVDAKEAAEKTSTEMYGRAEIGLMKTKKALFYWSIQNFCVLQERSPVRWIDNAYKNRTFTMSASRLSPKYVQESVQPDLRHTCCYFMDACDAEFAERIVQSFSQLSGKCIRVGTACSGTDICVTVIRQTVETLNLHQDTTVRVEQIFAVESDPEKRSYLMKEHPQCQHLFDDVKVFADGEGFCHVCGQIHEVSPRNLPIDVFICGPSCKDLSRLNTARRDKVGCYEEEDMNDSTLSGIIESTSGSTYKLGFRKVLQDYCPSIAIYENVRAANERSKDKNGTIQPSPVEAFTILDSQNFLVPQRRNRVYGIATLISGESKREEIKTNFIDCVKSMQTNFHFPAQTIFAALPEEPPKRGRHAKLVEMAQEQLPGKKNIFVDCSASLTRVTHCEDACGGGKAPSETSMVPAALENVVADLVAEHISRGEECSYAFVKNTLHTAIQQWNDVVEHVRGKDVMELLQLCDLTLDEDDAESHLAKINKKHAERICRKSGFLNRANPKPGKHLSPNHPQLLRVIDWVQMMIHQKKYHFQLIGNFDQIWSMCFLPAKQTLQMSLREPDELSKRISLRRIRHCVERVLGKEPTENLDGRGEVIAKVHPPRLQGGTVAQCPVEQYRVPRTLTSLSWADGSLGRGFVSCRKDSLTEGQRKQANEEGELRLRRKQLGLSLADKDILCGDSEQMQIPGGFGAAGQPNDGWHQYLHLLNRSYCAAAVGWSNSILLRKNGKLVWTAWLSRGMITEEHVAKYRFGGNVELVRQHLKSSRDSMQELLSLVVAPDMTSDKAELAQLEDLRTCPMPGEQCLIWAIQPLDAADDVSGRQPLPQWIATPVERAVARWVEEHQRWMDKIDQRQMDGKQLTARAQKDYDEWCQHASEVSMLFSKRLMGLANPPRKNANLSRLKQEMFTLTLNLSMDPHELRLRAGCGEPRRLMILKGEPDVGADLPEFVNEAVGEGLEEAFEEQRLHEEESGDECMHPDEIDGKADEDEARILKTSERQFLVWIWRRS
ncbi:Malate dehydrogenase 2 [Durusdinium trenchii]|uniref:Mitochondrial n=1 Tax=Durusdinium trenchii TaxID=1381693 RepID=A0ABP0MF47_9DINO